MITIKAKICRSIKDRTIGLIDRQKAEPMLFFTRFGIHTFGLKFPVDVLILGGDDRVVKIKENLTPNSFCFWLPKFNKVLELPAGYVKSMGIKNNSLVKIEK